MTTGSVVHRTFVIERLLKAPPRRVFRAWSDPGAKRRWTTSDPAMTSIGFSLDFRPHGSETNRVIGPGGGVHVFHGHFLDIVADERIIYAFDMLVGEARVSASLATVVFLPEGTGTRMVFTEQIALLDGRLDLEERIQGTEKLLERLAREVGEA